MPQIDFSLILVTSTFICLSFSFLYLVISCVFLPSLIYKYQTVQNYIFTIKLCLYKKKLLKLYVNFWFKSLNLVQIQIEYFCFNQLRFLNKIEFKSTYDQLKLLHNFRITFIKIKLIYLKTLT